MYINKIKLFIVPSVEPFTCDRGKGMNWNAGSLGSTAPSLDDSNFITGNYTGNQRRKDPQEDGLQDPVRHTEVDIQRENSPYGFSRHAGSHLASIVAYAAPQGTETPEPYLMRLAAVPGRQPKDLLGFGRNRSRG
jgi:hypothetical protein